MGDQEFTLFSRAWCVAEMATANVVGMQQQLKIYSAADLQRHENKVREMKVRNMKASRPEDAKRILDQIPDRDAFDRSMQQLIFQDILATWKNLDLLDKLLQAGQAVRWNGMGAPSGSVPFVIPTAPRFGSPRRQGQHNQ